MDEPLMAWQMGLQLDPTFLEVEGIETKADLIGFNLEENFGTTEIRDGKIRVLWYSIDTIPLKFNGKDLIFRLRVKAKRPIYDVHKIISLDNNVLLNVAYDKNGTPFRIQTEGSNLERTQLDFKPYLSESLIVVALPNPFANEIVFKTESKLNEIGTLTIYNAIGEIVASWNGEIPLGTGEVSFTNTALWGNGVFRYALKTSTQSSVGSIVKI